jgi:hypothetical protein
VLSAEKIQEETRIRQSYEWKLLTCVLAILFLTLVLESAHAAPNSPIENVTLSSGSLLVVSSTQQTIKSVIVRGNLTAATISNPSYPSRNVTLTTNTTQLYTVNILLSYPAQYSTSILVRDQTTKTNSVYTSYFVSGGDLNLTIYATFQAPPPSGGLGPVGWPSFANWISQFGNAFPSWVKILYGILAIQFAFVGHRWVKFEDEKRKIEGHLPPLDQGNKLYLWTDIVFRALVAGFIVSLVVMVGEVLVVGLAQYLFLVNLSLFPLLDFFSLFFVAAVATLFWLGREGLDRFLDLKPMVDD